MKGSGVGDTFILKALPCIKLLYLWTAELQRRKAGI
jgi:hypothetical protein